jgi:hypothetical protein
MGVHLVSYTEYGRSQMYKIKYVDLVMLRGACKYATNEQAQAAVFKPNRNVAGIHRHIQHSPNARKYLTKEILYNSEQKRQRHLLMRFSDYRIIKTSVTTNRQGGLRLGYDQGSYGCGPYSGWCQ